MTKNQKKEIEKKYIFKIMKKKEERKNREEEYKRKRGRPQTEGTERET